MFHESTKDREINAVNSEFQKNLQDDINIPLKSLIYTSFDIFILFLWLSIYFVLKKVIILNKKFETTL